MQAKFSVRLQYLLLLTFWIAPGAGFAQVFRHFTDREGAPITTVMSITQDKEGFMWFGTSRGLYRYDSKSFKRYKSSPGDPSSIGSDYVHQIYQDSKGRLWATTWGDGGGLSLYNRETDSFRTFRHDPSDPGSVLPSMVSCLVEDCEKNFWFATAHKLGRIVFDDDSMQIMHEDIHMKETIKCLVADPKGGFWIGTDNGLFKFENGRVKPLGQQQSEKGGIFNTIFSAYLDRKGSLWLGTGLGLVRFDTSTQQYLPIMSVQKNQVRPTVYQIAEDLNHKLWLATESGLVFFDPETEQVRWHIKEKTNPYALVDDALMSVYTDQQKALWIGTYYQGISYMNTNLPDFSLWPVLSGNRSADFYQARKVGKTAGGKLWAISANNDKIWISRPGNTENQLVNLNFPLGDKYYAFFLDDSNILWCGGDDCLFVRYDLKTGKTVTYLPKEVFQGNRPPNSRISTLFGDSRGIIWISCALGLVSFDPRTNHFRRIEYNDSLLSMHEDSKGNLWFGGLYHIYIFKHNSQKLEIVKINRRKEMRNHLFACRIAEDNSGRIWAATQNGLFLYDRKTDSFLLHISDAPELLSYVQDIQIDSKGFLWLNGEYKLICYHPGKRRVRVYDYRDGLPYGGVLIFGSSLNDESGILYFPTSEGTFSFNPDKIISNYKAMPLVLTSLKLFNRQVNVGDRTALLDKSIEVSEQITFRHDQNVFTLDFALLSYGRSEMNRYAYTLEGFEKNWNYVQTPSATYTNLSPGTYTFLAKAANGDGYWNPKPLRLKITILPPWWKTWYAYLCYILLLASAVYAITRFLWLRSSFRKENALNQVKLDFFTNVSHEIRTHLSLISGPLEKAYGQFKEGQSVERNLNYARSNSDRLSLLVNELLDFRKIQSGSVRLQVQEYDVVRIMKGVMAAFEHTAREKGIETTLVCPETPVLLWLDMGQMQKVFYNLLSNAYKFTPEGGKVEVRIVETSNEVDITVKDNGKGISQAHVQKLFTYYYQADSEKPGYGIGLALSKSIVEQHRGQLTAQSQLAGESTPGSTALTIRMLRENRHFSPDQIASKTGDYIGSTPAEMVAMLPVNPNGVDTRKTNTILIIEDNDQLRVFIRDLFEGEFNTLEAENGLQGLQLANEHLPDIVLSDIMMPDMNGLQVCSHLKEGITTSHIPVVLLTARAQNHQIIEGLATGADDYLVKPFDPRILELKIRNLIRQRDELKNRYRESVLTGEKQSKRIARDKNEEFIAKLSSLVRENISNRDFGVDELAMQTGMSVSSLYRKLRSLTGMTVNDFIKTVRFNEAKELLESGVYSVSEVGTMIGFEGSRYFSIEFKKIFGKTPIEAKKQVPD
ncbi:Two component regulator propeller [Dyadobacter sp. SG02]|nr:Two component regulator propeller [Dyadobacter sp. SG02]